MEISWSTIQSLLLFFGPMFGPRLYRYYREYRTGTRRQDFTVRPLPTNVARSLIVLSIVIASFLLRALPIFAPENVFQVTQSRLQVPVDVLFNRLSSLRPSEMALTQADVALRARFVNLESRLLYIQFGPGPLTECPYCSSDDPKSFFYYAALDILQPHLLNLAVLGLLTSPFFTGREGAARRTYVTLSSMGLMLLDISNVYSYNYQLNRTATRLADVDFFYWRYRSYRLIALAALDFAVGVLLYLAATHRAFVKPLTPAERVERLARALQGVKGKVSAAGVFKNTVLRDEELKGRSQAYWSHEGLLMRDVMEDREVVDGVNDALQNRVDVPRITVDAESYANSILQPMMPEEEPTVVG